MCVSSKAQEIDPALEKYVAMFKAEAESRGHAVHTNVHCVKFPSRYEDSILQISKMKPHNSWGGLAVINDNTHEAFVFINPTIFYYSDEVGREMLVFHELFHAFYKIPHTDDEAIMKINISDADSKNYMINRKSILDKLFNKISK